MDGVLLTKEEVIKNEKGDIFHFIKSTDEGFEKFGECYFSTINQNEIKGWKLHKNMTMNLVVPKGKIKFVVYNSFQENFFETILSNKNYFRLTIKNGLWVAFKGLESYNILANLASIQHDPDESINMDITKVKYNW